MTPTGKLLALDVGLKRIGVAVCDPLQLTVRPLTVVQRRSRNEDFAALAELIRTQEALAVVCGLPLNMDGTEGEQARITRRWATRLAHALQTRLGHAVQIIFWDERLTTFAAQEYGRAATRRWGEDALAAAVLLESFLDAQRRGERLSFGYAE
jgi:putative Holliday junction resolvase